MMRRRGARRQGRPPRVLIINQRMDRTGAPVQLATLLEQLAGNLDVHLTLLAGTQGPMTSVMAPHVDRVVHESTTLRVVSWVERQLPSFGRRPVRAIWTYGMRRRTGRPHLVYVNSLISHRLASAFRASPTIVHVHEFGAFAEGLGTAASEMLVRATRVLVPSDAVADWAAAKGVDRRIIELLPGTIPARAFDPPEQNAVGELLAELGVPSGSRLVASIGWFGRPKGSDRFLDVAQRMAETSPTVHFVWVGGGSGSGSEAAFREDVRRLGLDDVITIVPGRDDLRSVYAAVDLVLVPSREESLSLVALEAAAQGTPVVYFPGSGGPDHLAREGITIRPAGSDADSVAATVAAVLARGPEGASIRTTTKETVRQRHGAEAALPVLRNVVREGLDAAGARMGVGEDTPPP